MLVFLWFMSLQWIISECQLDYYIVRRFQSDCLQYYSTHSLTSFKREYCLRPTADGHQAESDFINTRDQNYTFEQLRELNVTVNEVFHWSASLDLAEKYQYYLDHPSEPISPNSIFFNCTRPRFGSQCQYSLEVDETIPPGDLPAAKYTCYTLLECDRGSSFLCLDWREICDGRIDCFNGGVDEAQCFDLEVNECKSSEYRCHNGQCIPGHFWKNDRNTVECLDQSNVRDKRHCPNSDPTSELFECEENSCPPGPNKFSCGDGECVKDFHECQNGRHLMLFKAMTIQGELPYDCWLAMVCFTKVIDPLNTTLCEEFFQSSNLTEHLRTCDVLVQFPQIPVLFGHIRFLYYPKETFELNTNSTLIPKYICYDAQLCPFLIPAWHNASYTCQHSDDFGLKANTEYPSWKSIIDIVKPYFYGCEIKYSITNYSQHSLLYQCKDSSKRMSTSRILDGIPDCHLEDDEQAFDLSCALNDSYRSKCPNKTQCWSPIINSDICLSVDEKAPSIDQIYFSQICDRYTDLPPQLINGRNHTDETNCEHWPCSNMYTQCDGFWNCPNGTDEANCGQASCPPHFLPCTSPYNFTAICLPASQVHDGIIDCLGGLDELQLCRVSDDHEDVSYRFVCLDGKTCVEPSTLCSSYSDEMYDQDLCDEWIGYNHTELEHLLCAIDVHSRIVFTLAKSQVYPPAVNGSIDHDSDVKMEQSSDVDRKNFQLEAVSFSSLRTRGAVVQLRHGNEQHSLAGFCRPNYYGRMCEYQNQRVSLTLAVSAVNINSVYSILVRLIDDDDDRQETHSHEQVIFVSRVDCKRTFSIYLLYSTRPKNLSKNVSIHIDVYNKTALQYLASWRAEILYAFLPVNRVSLLMTLLRNPMHHPDPCPLLCKQGTCMKYVNVEKFFCRCNDGWSGARCHIPVDCRSCSPGSLCVGSAHRHPICICPLEKFGSRCHFKHSCPENYCQNGGLCLVIDERPTNDSYLCVCSEPFQGVRCDIPPPKLQMTLRNMQSASHLVAYVFSFVRSEPPSPKQRILKKLTSFQRSVVLYLRYAYRIVFIRFDSAYYLAVLQPTVVSNLSTTIDSTRRCHAVDELLPSEQLKLPRIERVKLYHRLCQNNLNQQCFFDESLMCLCTTEQYANCFPFDRQYDFPCLEDIYCQNDGQCLQDHSICPRTTICICVDCFFGDRCQFYAKGIGMTLDDILRYEVRPNTNVRQQPASIIATICFTVILFVLGWVNSILSFLTFKRPKPQKVGCGMYLFVLSINNAITVTVLSMKFWFILLTQLYLSTNYIFLRVGCISMELLVKSSLWMGNWLNVCVSIERAVNISRGVSFNRLASKRIAWQVIIGLPFAVIGSTVYENVFRDVFRADGEQHSWCVTPYSPSRYIYMTIISFFHLLAPFVSNVLSAVYLMYTAARQRAIARPGLTYLKYLKEQFFAHKQLIISPLVLIALAIPLLVMSLSFQCVKNSNSPWWNLYSYMLAFTPPILTFVIYIWPSHLYMGEFRAAMADCQKFLGGQ